MTLKTKSILNKVLSLEPAEKISIVDQLLCSLDKPDPSIEKLWKKEVESRLRAVKSGKLKTVTASQALSKYRHIKAA